MLVHINVTVQNQLQRLFVQGPPCQNTNFTAFTPPSLLQGIQETTLRHYTQYPSDQFILGTRVKQTHYNKNIKFW